MEASAKTHAKILDDSDRTATAQLLISVACTNSVRHSNSRHAGMFTLALSASGNAIRCEVIAAGASTLPTRRHGTEPRDHGHGIPLIETLATRFGYDADGTGRLHTWFEIT